MEIEAFLADSVVTSEGKLFVQGGGWNAINTASLPTRHSRVGIALVVRIPYTATNQPHRFEIRLEDEDGQERPLGNAPPESEGEAPGTISRIGGEFNVGRPANLYPGEEQLLPFAINLDGLLFDRAGAYRFVIEIDGTEAKSLPFRVNQVPQIGPVRGR